VSGTTVVGNVLDEVELAVSESVFSPGKVTG
jgi:hypothetical protein